MRYRLYSFFRRVDVKLLKCRMLRVLKGNQSIKGSRGGAAWSMNIRGGAAGKSEKLPCHGVKFS